MDPATIAALTVGVTSFVSIIAAGIVACCRKQINSADKNDQNNSNDCVEITIGESRKITETINGRTIVTEISPAIKFNVSMVDSGAGATNASNRIDGYDKNTIPVTPTSSAVTNTAAAALASSSAPAAASSSAPAASSNAVAVSTTTESVSHPVPVDSQFLSQDRPSVGSTLTIGKITIVAGAHRIDFNGLSSSDVMGAQESSTKQTVSLQQHIGESGTEANDQHHSEAAPLLLTSEANAVTIGDTSSHT